MGHRSSSSTDGRVGEGLRGSWRGGHGRGVEHEKVGGWLGLLTVARWVWHLSLHELSRSSGEAGGEGVAWRSEKADACGGWRVVERLGGLLVSGRLVGGLGRRRVRGKG